jgi:anti-sigma B factor antagonist
MFKIKFGDQGQVVLKGRLDAAQTDTARQFFESVTDSRIIDCSGLEYISSAGLGVLLKVQKRLMAANNELTLVDLNNHILDVFRYAGLDRVFKIEKGGSSSSG